MGGGALPYALWTPLVVQFPGGTVSNMFDQGKFNTRLLVACVQMQDKNTLVMLCVAWRMDSQDVLRYCAELGYHPPVQFIEWMSLGLWTFQGEL